MKDLKAAELPHLTHVQVVRTSWQGKQWQASHCSSPILQNKTSPNKLYRNNANKFVA